MITNQQQYRLTQQQIAKFETALKQATTNPDQSLHPLLQKAQVDALQSQLADLRAELATYEARRTSQLANKRGSSVLELSSLTDLPRALIKARVANGFTQRDLAELLGIAEIEIKQYEATAYADARFTRITAVAQALGIGSPTVIRHVF